jgi:hypothetical protein
LSDADVSAGRTARRRQALGRPAVRRLAVAYVVGLHLAIGALVVKTDFLDRLHHRWAVLAAPEFDGGYRRWASALARSDAFARPDALVFLGDSMLRDLDTSSIARHTLNLAISGDTTAGLLGRIRAYRSVETARGVVVGVGPNDLA